MVELPDLELPENPRLAGNITQYKLCGIDISDTDGMEKALYELKIDLEYNVLAKDSLVMSRSATKNTLGKVFVVVGLVFAL